MLADAGTVAVGHPVLAPNDTPNRQPGRLKGRIAVGLEFFEALPEEELSAWEGS